MARRSGNGGVRAHRPRARADAGLALCLIALVCGCGPRNYANENDRLRREVIELRSDLQDVRAERDEALSRAAEAGLGGGGAGGVPEALPRAAGIEIGGLSGPLDGDGDGKADAVEVYVRPYDGRRRFLQVAGELSVRVDALAEPRGAGESGGERSEGQGALLGSEGVVLGSGELAERYRSGLTGTHYAVRVGLPAGWGEPGSVLVARVELRDALTGRVLRATRLLRRAAGGATLR